MDSYYFVKTIISKLETKLQRKLTGKELQVFTMPRSGLAYEMILDVISSEQKSKEDVEEYVKAVVKEYDGISS